MNEQNSPLFGYDPDSLADHLDQLFPPDSDFVSDAGVANADPLIDMAGRLTAAPKLEPSADALARIQARMNAAIPTSAALPQPAKPRPIIHWPVIVLAAAAAMALTLVVVGRLVTSVGETPGQIAQQSTETAAALVILTETSTTAVSTTAVPTTTVPTTAVPTTAVPTTAVPTTAVPTTAVPTTAASTVATSTPTPDTAPTDAVTQASETPEIPTATSTAVPPTVSPTLSPSSTPSDVPASPTATATTQAVAASPTLTPSPVDTVEPAPTLPPTATVTPTPLPGHLIIEGQIDTIEANVIDIYGIQVSLDEDEPLLKVLRVEDFVRVEGSFEDIDGVLIVDVFTIELVTEDGEGIDVTVNPANPGDVWRDSGDCSNPPPDWAPAVGWRRRCENSGSPGSPGNPGNPGGQGNPGGKGNPDPGKPADPGKPGDDD